MSSREAPNADDGSIKSAQLAELWSELLELRKKVQLAEDRKKEKKPNGRPNS